MYFSALICNFLYPFQNSIQIFWKKAARVCEARGELFRKIRLCRFSEKRTHFGIKYSRIWSLIEKLYSDKTAIIMLHRVTTTINYSCASPLSGLEISAANLEKFILDRLSEGYKFISMDNLCDNFEKCLKKHLIITLDDGYKDNLTVAYPIFKKYNIPFTVYITNSFPDKCCKLWWYALYELAQNNSKVCFDMGGRNLFFEKNALKDEMFYKKLRDFYLSLNKAEEEIIYRQILEETGFAPDLGKEILDWRDVIELANDNLCTIGAHTGNHVNLRNLSKEEIFDEIYNAKVEVENKIRQRINHFSYPYGTNDSVNNEIIELVKDFGFKTAVITERDYINKKCSDAMHSLPRIGLNNYNYSKDRMNYLLNGVVIIKQRLLRKCVLQKRLML